MLNPWNSQFFSDLQVFMEINQQISEYVVYNLDEYLCVLLNFFKSQLIFALNFKI